jgi:hypothetical protein
MFEKIKIHILILLTFTCINSVLAEPKCNCVPVASAVAAKESSTHVYIGEVLKVTLSKTQTQGIDNNEKNFVVKTRVVKYWKGNFEEEITIRTSKEKSACGFPFRKDKYYLIYAIGAKHPKVTSCSRTSELNSTNAYSDLKVLGDAKYLDLEKEEMPDFLK